MTPHTLEIVLFESCFHLLSSPMRFLRSAGDVMSLVSSPHASRERRDSNSPPLGLIHNGVLLLDTLLICIYFPTGANADTIDVCFQEGECTESFHIKSEILSDEYECLEACKSTSNCTW